MRKTERTVKQMAKVDIKMPDEFLMRISKLADRTDEIVPKVLGAGGEVVLAKVKANLQSVIGKDTKAESRSTGELISALGLSPAKLKRDGSGWDIKVGFAESRSDGESNAKIANILEYGKHNQPPRPFLKPAKSSSKKECISAMVDKLAEEIGKI
jgi:HK97 gp10 family phage protein